MKVLDKIPNGKEFIKSIDIFLGCEYNNIRDRQQVCLLKRRNERLCQQSVFRGASGGLYVQTAS